MEDLAARLDEVRETDPLLADVVAADAAARAATAELSELHDLRQRVEVEAPDRPLLRWWTLAILGERAFLGNDLAVIPLAAQVLPELPDEPFLATPLLYVRGRLRRIAAAVYLVAPLTAALAEHRRLRDAAVADFLRCGFTAEAAVTRGLATALHALATWDDVLEDLEIVRDARAQLGDLEGSMWVPVLDHLLSAVALAAGDLVTAGTALDALERRRHLHPVFAAYADVGRADHALLQSGGSARAADELVAALDRLRQDQPQLLPLMQQHAAHLLADHGHVAPARALGLAALGWPASSPVMAVVGQVLRVRLDILTVGQGADHRRTPHAGGPGPPPHPGGPDLPPHPGGPDPPQRTGTADPPPHTDAADPPQHANDPHAPQHPGGPDRPPHPGTADPPKHPGAAEACGAPVPTGDSGRISARAPGGRGDRGPRDGHGGDETPRLEPALDQAWSALGQLEQMGLRRRAGALALRLSRDLDRVGDDGSADTLRAWGLARMPPPPRQTVWERRWAEPLAGSEPPTRGARSAGLPAVHVRVLRPVLEVEVDGRPVRLRDMPAKLLLALVLAHPDPLHVEQAVDVLWPDAPVETGRSRLNTVVHRLRSALDIGPGALRRVGEVLLLVPDGWDVDLFRYRRARRERSDWQLDALRPEISGNLCHVQFPYDDYFVEHRHALDVPDARC